VSKKNFSLQGAHFQKLFTLEDTMRKLFAILTVLTAAVFFTQNAIASESYSASRIENVKASAGQKKKDQKAQQKKTQAKKQIQKKNTGKKKGKK
jgi:hypothetical protein